MGVPLLGVPGISLEVKNQRAFQCFGRTQGVVVYLRFF